MWNVRTLGVAVREKAERLHWVVWVEARRLNGIVWDGGRFCWATWVLKG